VGLFEFFIAFNLDLTDCNGLQVKPAVTQPLDAPTLASTHEVHG
jgi:hypothetical protein